MGPTTDAPHISLSSAAASRPIRLLFSGHDYKFAKPIMEHYKSHRRFRVRVETHEGHYIKHHGECAKLLKRADVIFCEWCLDNAVYFSKQKRPDQALIVRLHRQEMHLDHLEKVHWPAVDHLVMICPENHRQFLALRPEMASRCSVIYNLVPSGSLDQPKLPGAEFNLGLVGIVPMLKRMDLALDILDALRQRDRRFCLFLKGHKPEAYSWMQKRHDEKEFYRRCMRRIEKSPHRNSIVFDPFGNEMADWYSKIGFILSTSDTEGSHQAVAEGMASGAIPLIRDWAGADQLYPPQFVWHDVPQAVESLLRWKTQEHYSPQADFCRKFARESFDEKLILSQYDQLMQRLLADRGIHWNENDAAVEIRSQGDASNPAAAATAKPTILHVCYLAIGATNGTRTHATELSRHLTSIGHRVELAVFIPTKEASDAKAVESFRRALAAESNAARVHFLKTKHFFDLKPSSGREKEMVKPLSKLARACGAEVIEGQGCYAAWLVLDTAALVPGLRTVFDCRGANPEETLMSTGDTNRAAALEAMEKRALSRADMTVMVSNRMGEHYRLKLGIVPPERQIVPVCVHLDEFSLDASLRARARQELGVADKTVLAYVGTLKAWQWPQAMLDVFAKLRPEMPDAYLLLLLPTADHARARELCREYGLPESSYHMREVAHDQLGQILVAADVGFLLRKENPVNHVSSPTKFGEYLASGVPVLATAAVGDFSGWIDELKVGRLLRFDGNSIDLPQVRELAKFLREVQADRDRWRTHCRQAAIDRLDWSHRIQALSEAYQRIVNKKG